jgi:hypothetical protein
MIPRRWCIMVEEKKIELREIPRSAGEEDNEITRLHDYFHLICSLKVLLSDDLRCDGIVDLVEELT